MSDDSQTLREFISLSPESGGDQTAARAALARLEAAANRTASLEQQLELANIHWRGLLCADCGTGGECGLTVKPLCHLKQEALEAERDAALARAAELAGAIEDYLLWQPGRWGHAAAARRLRAVLGGPEA